MAGGNATAGRVEVLFDGKWGTICDDHWGMSDAEVVCRQLNLGKPLAITKKASPFGEGSGEILAGWERIRIIISFSLFILASLSIHASREARSMAKI